MSMSVCKFASVLALSGVLSACGGGYGGGGGGGGGYGEPPPSQMFTVGGSVQGLNGTVVLANGSNTASVTATAGAVTLFTFSTSIATGGSYNVTVQTQPTNQTCAVANGAAVIGSANVTNVAVTCTDVGGGGSGDDPSPPTQGSGAQLSADASARRVTLSWSDPAASSFNLYRCETRLCDVSSIAPMLSSVISPRTIGELDNGEIYFFRAESVYPNGSRALSNVVAARPNAWVFNDSVNALARADDGTVYLGGDFTEVGIASGAAVPLNRTTGRPVSGDFVLVNDVVFAIVSDTQDGWYLGGMFHHGGVRKNLIHVLADGSVDPNFNARLDYVDDYIQALAYRNGVLYIGGNFESAGGLDQSGVAALDGSTGAALGGFNGVFSQINALTVSGDTLYAGGTLGIEDPGQESLRLSCIAAFNLADRTLIPSFRLSAGDCDVHAIAVADGTVYAGGRFAQIGGLARSGVAALDANGEAIEMFDARAGLSPTANVFALAVVGDKLFVGGVLGETEADLHLIALDRRDGHTIEDFAAPANGVVHALASADNTLYVAGEFTRIGDSNRGRVAALDVGSGAVHGLDVRASATVSALAVTNDTLYIGGRFTSIDSKQRRRLAALDQDGELLSWSSGADGRVRALAVTGGLAPTIYAGGEFNLIDEAPRRALAALDADGNIVTGFNAQAGIDNSSTLSIRALTLGHSGALYAGGNFTTLGQRDNANLAALNPRNGLAFETFEGQPSGPVNALVTSDSTLYIGGEFEAVRDRSVPQGRLHTRARLAALDPITGAVQDNFTQGAPGGTGVNALALSGSTLYVGGWFARLEGGNCLAALHSQTGQPLAAFRWYFDDPVLALAVFDGIVYVGGRFTEIHSAEEIEPLRRHRLAAFNSDGTVREFQDVSSLSFTVGVRALHASGDTIYVGGNFHAVGGELRSGFATIATDGQIR